LDLLIGVVLNNDLRAARQAFVKNKKGVTLWPRLSG